MKFYQTSIINTPVYRSLLKQSCYHRTEFKFFSCRGRLEVVALLSEADTTFADVGPRCLLPRELTSENIKTLKRCCEINKFIFMGNSVSGKIPRQLGQIPKQPGIALDKQTNPKTTWKAYIFEKTSNSSLLL